MAGAGLRATSVVNIGARATFLFKPRSEQSISLTEMPRFRWLPRHARTKVTVAARTALAQFGTGADVTHSAFTTTTENTSNKFGACHVVDDV